MADIPWSIGSQADLTQLSCVGFFLKVSSTTPLGVPEMTLVDLDAGASGYWRFSLEYPNSGVIKVKLAAALAQHSSVDTWQGEVDMGVDDNLALDTWYWITGDQGATGYRLNLGVTGPGNTLTMYTSAATHGPTQADNYLVRLGWGKTLSSSNLDFYDDPAAGAMSKLWLSRGKTTVTDNSVPVLTMPTQDPSAAPPTVALYLCHETPSESATILHDATANHFDLASAGTLVVTAEGPFIS